MRYSSQKIALEIALGSVTLILHQERLHQQCSKSTPTLAIKYRKNKSSRMLVMTVRDERKKLKRVSPLLITPELSTAWTREQVECTMANGLLARHCFLYMQQRLQKMFFIVLLNSIRQPCA
jgi:hypothetical protein